MISRDDILKIASELDPTAGKGVGKNFILNPDDVVELVRRALSRTAPGVAEGWERFFPFEFEVWQRDEMCASASGTREQALAEAKHYAAQYEQDGPVRIFEVRRILVAAPSADKEGS